MKSCNFMMETAVFGYLESNAAVVLAQSGPCLPVNGLKLLNKILHKNRAGPSSK